MNVELQINNSTDPKSRYLSWVPSPCRIRVTNPAGTSGATVNIRLSGTSTAGGGRVRFRKLPTAELQRIGRVAAARAEVAWYQGELDLVAREVAVGLEAAEGHRDPCIRGELAFWHSRARPDAKIPTDIFVPYRLMIEGHWQAAAEAWEKRGMPYERALALADGPEEALRDALVILEELDAGPLAAIVRQRLRELGVRGIPRGPRASTRGNPAGLTAREVDVLRLLVRGHTNAELARRLHLSAKTVDHHVSSILEKLEVHSRTEAVAAAFGLGIVKAAENEMSK